MAAVSKAEAQVRGGLAGMNGRFRVWSTTDSTTVIERKAEGAKRAAIIRLPSSAQRAHTGGARGRQSAWCGTGRRSRVSASSGAVCGVGGRCASRGGGSHGSPRSHRDRAAETGRRQNARWSGARADGAGCSDTTARRRLDEHDGGAGDGTSAGRLGMLVMSAFGR